MGVVWLSTHYDRVIGNYVLFSCLDPQCRLDGRAVSTLWLRFAVYRAGPHWCGIAFDFYGTRGSSHPNRPRSVAVSFWSLLPCLGLADMVAVVLVCLPRDLYLAGLQSSYFAGAIYGVSGRCLSGIIVVGIYLGTAWPLDLYCSGKVGYAPWHIKTQRLITV